MRYIYPIYFLWLIDMNKVSNTALIDLRLWQQFAAVAQYLHFGRAAQALHMTQPPLTQAIAALEARLNVRLFERTKRSVNLTSAGASLLPGARELIKMAQQLAAQAQDAASGEVGRLRIGFVSPLGLGPLPLWVREFRSAYPRVALELVEATGDVQERMLEQRELDAGFMLHEPQFSPVGLKCLPLGSEPMVLALPHTHLLAKPQASTLPLLPVLREPLVLFPRRILPSIHDALSALYHSHGQSLQIAQEAIQMQTIVNLVSAGLGVAWVSASVANFQRSGVVYRRVRWPAHQAIQCASSLVWADASVPKTLHHFIETVSAQRSKNT
jgi:DNA-binding transcriptional LysR family regulator